MMLLFEGAVVVVTMELEVFCGFRLLRFIIGLSGLPVVLTGVVERILSCFMSREGGRVEEASGTEAVVSCCWRVFVCGGERLELVVVVGMVPDVPPLLVDLFLN